MAPPFTAIAAAVEAAAGSAIAIAAQDMYWANEGAFTGEVSPRMLVEAGCGGVIIAHSERRQFFGETDETRQSQGEGGAGGGIDADTVRGRDAGANGKRADMQKVLDRQFRGSLAALTSPEFSRIIMAYEPVWAIGTGRTATPEMAAEAHRFLRDLAAGSFSAEARRVPANPLRRKRQTRKHKGIDGAGGYRRGAGGRRKPGCEAVCGDCELLEAFQG